MKEYGGRDLRQLLAAMEPRLLPDEFVFCTVAPERNRERKEAIATCPAGPQEEKIEPCLERSLRSAGVPIWPGMPHRLTVHSALDAVGLTAAISGRLARQGISANVVAAYFHDHVFVPAARAEEALEALRELSTRQED